MARRWLIRMVYLLLATSALANSGCLALAIGGAAGGAAAGYALWERGKWARDYPANVTDTTSAVRTALGELKLPIVEEKGDGEDMIIDSRTGDGDKIRIQLTPVGSRIPADGATTHVSIRVGTLSLGDEALSRRLHEQITLHLVAPVLIRPSETNPAPVATTSAWMPPKPAETAPPPLAK